jgi:hypothetical protein
MMSRASQPAPIPESHSLGRFFRSSTESAFDAVGVRDGEIIEYVWKMLLRFVHVDQLFRKSCKTGGRMEHVMDFLTEAQGMENTSTRELKKQMGDVCLFFTGLYPENLEYRKKNPQFYVSQGKAAYYHVAEIDALRPSARFFRKLTDRFEECVMALHVEREFMHDSVYQYIGRQFGV